MITTPDGVTTSDLETHEKTIYILNRSFEKVDSRTAERFGRTRNGTPASPKIPLDWNAASGFDYTSAIEGSWARYYKESIYPKHGKYYACLDIGPEGKGELSQKLYKPLEIDAEYSFSYNACSYQLNEKLSEEYSTAQQPCRLKIWGSFDGREKMEALYESAPIIFHDWKKETIEISPIDSYTHIIFEIIPDESNSSGIGNILLDDLSNIERL